MKIAIIDYGAGNLNSVARGLAFVGTPGRITGDPAEIEAADALVLPGVGAFEACMRQVEPLKKVILERVDAGVPLLGICLGMQMFYEASEENGRHEGLKIVPGTVSRFAGGLKVPHMGWNSLSVEREHPLLKGIETGSYVYFVHSYRAEVSPCTVASADYGGAFTAIVSNDAGNAVGTQFHPEKSGPVGLRMLKNFAEMI
ncbi:imidazole glycerol phosphate synthase subunit HisH [Methanocella arvoryzae]|uniref:Imidazole glycerol phosphate synthase subunit HisH n=1 Tax=Methanocella arvoryzae (strain DSM 22066 / NBRC 105507 / MRE50) TaxID=351160 RepID=Q0W3A2_METAR|nr:imidazole glycerol phosphate synthase subunit HisH [Methanocella arvoryzae]CAJ37141.1 imidazole glycerol phosphate synthase, glutamine amidotransferase subunit [Methanocella arvoryzae MRE50]